MKEPFGYDYNGGDLLRNGSVAVTSNSSELTSTSRTSASSKNGDHEKFTRPASCCILAATLIANTNGHVIRFCGALNCLYFFTSSIRLTVSVAFLVCYSPRIAFVWYGDRRTINPPS
ncbi:hypothetical protein PTI98_004078 [Pleurotus ostreatus]|nr:hypothetical protein PTI98_004078 [Pleurotus ostreatus]